MSRRNRKQRKKIIRRRRILLLLIVLIFIPVLYGGSKFTVNKIKLLYSTITNGKSVTGNGTSGGEEIEGAEVRNIKLLSVGDIMFDIPQIKSAYTGDGKYDFTSSFKYVKNYIENADIAIGNFVSVAAGNDKKFSGAPQFNSPKETLRDLKKTGFDLITTANNHSLDCGRTGLLNTLKYAKEYNLKTVGTYEEAGNSYLIEEKDGIKVGFLAYTDRLNGLEFYLSDEELSYMVNLIDEEKLKKDIEKLEEKADIVIVSVHWGEEYQREPSAKQIDLAHKMVDWGANLIIGSGPQVLQETETLRRAGKDNFIVYSMGNFLSSQRENTVGNSFAEDGVMLEVDIEKNFTDGSSFIRSIEFLPTWVNNYNQDGKEMFQILPTLDVLSESIDIELDNKVLDRIKKSQADSFEKLNYK